MANVRFEASTGMPRQVDALVSRGGMENMRASIWLIIGAVTFGILVDDFELLGNARHATAAQGHQHRQALRLPV